MLGGGILVGTDTVVYGKYSVGKTAFCSTVTCRLFLPFDPVPVLDEWNKPFIDPSSGKPLLFNMGGLVKKDEPLPKVLWLDTEGTFNTQLIIKIRREKGQGSIKTKDFEVSDDDEVTLLSDKAKQRSKEVTARAIKSRFTQICEHIGLDFEKDVRPNLILSSARTPDALIQKIKNALQNSSQHNIRLIVLDSITKPFRAERGKEDVKMNQLAINSQKLQYIFQMLKDLSSSTPRGAALVCTNQTYQSLDPYKARADKGTGKYTDIQYGGNAVFFNVDNHLHMYIEKNIRNVQLVDSSYMPKELDIFGVTEAGIVDVED
jgi:RecA/RadA recombinase